MNGLSLFSGAGIGELALKQIIPNYRTVGYVEWEAYCQEVIRARIKDGLWPTVWGIEWIMGWPKGWSNAYVPLEMDGFRRWLGEF